MTDDENFKLERMQFHRDPSGRHPYRAVVDGKWSDVVANGPLSLRTRRDNTGAEWLRDAPIPEIVTPPPRVDPDLVLPPGSPQWEYRIISATFGSDLEAKLNRFGAAGWEVLSITAANGTLTITGNKIFALIKRQVPCPEDRPTIQ